MASLPFRLKVPKREELGFAGASSTRFRFRGLLHVQEEALYLEWTGTARVERFGLTGIGKETLQLPAENMTLPFARLGDIMLQGGWILPRLVLMGNDLDALRIVPSEDGGRVCLWLARRDRRLAADLVQQVRARL
jgi:hypothetical protein